MTKLNLGCAVLTAVATFAAMSSYRAKYIKLTLAFAALAIYVFILGAPNGL